jgi:hypothetical protein
MPNRAVLAEEEVSIVRMVRQAWGQYMVDLVVVAAAVFKPRLNALVEQAH